MKNATILAAFACFVATASVCAKTHFAKLMEKGDRKAARGKYDKAIAFYQKAREARDRRHSAFEQRYKALDVDWAIARVYERRGADKAGIEWYKECSRIRNLPPRHRSGALANF
jgi:tetratricopeptide (TPR) repeat protein